MLVHRRSLPRSFVRFLQQFAGTHLYTWVERGTVTVTTSACPKNTTQCPRPGLEPGPLASDSSALTMRPPFLPLRWRVVKYSRIVKCSRVAKKDLKDNKHNCWFSVSRHSKLYRNKNQNLSIDKVRNLEKNEEGNHAEPLAKRFRPQQFFLGKICGEMFYPNLKL